MAKARRTRKPALTRDRVLDAALKHADKNGLEGLNMRALATALGAGVMSIYHHVDNKDDLLDAMVDRVAAEIDCDTGDQPWREAVASLAVSAHRMLMRHRWAAGLWSHHGMGPAKLAYMEAILRSLRQGGFSVGLACRAYHAITMHVHGFSLQVIDFPIKLSDVQQAAADFLSDADELGAGPYFIEHIQHHVDHEEPGDDFEFMLGLILDGFEHLLDAEQRG